MQENNIYMRYKGRISWKVEIKYFVLKYKIRIEITDIRREIATRIRNIEKMSCFEENGLS